MIKFGPLKSGCYYECRLKVKNEDIMSQRIVIKQPRHKVLRVYTEKFGLIALGNYREVIVRIHAKGEVIGNFKS